MKYPITYKAELPLSWESRSTIIEMELSDEEVKQIQSMVIPGQVKRTYSNVAKHFPELSSRLFDAGLDFAWYAEYLDARLSGIWRENVDCNINEQKLMKEDIASNKFDPHSEDGKLLRGQRRYNAWLKWEEEQLESLPFDKRSSFYEHRYDIHDMEFDENALSILFPDEIIVPALERLKNAGGTSTDYLITFVDKWNELVPATRTATLPVPLTEGEVQQIREIVPSGQEKDAHCLISNLLPALHHKIVDYATDFVFYNELLYKRRCQQYEYEYQGNIEEADRKYMKEDMEQRGYDPHDENGVLLEGDALLQHWMDWEEKQLEDMDYGDRCKFYYDRYCVQNDYATSPKYVTFYFPEDFFKP